ncbi:tagatose-bisphosphate aldolase [Faecalicoccus pleomorphus]|uniref:D-tagatose-1,6-bisphosphate aldolase subunit kbaZ n=1 Tax=Faecalicoccus pleomorphus TaxID=1323 RepID=A0A380LJ40_9FIRM|nr:class II D-tagatose-bisphosphate aldolase, non-catalytic subunit [Faecalicoccus pleomorphus]MBM6765206.1 class II D-tagatose-bisphosphate aldolase, non-catalytic subunit [Faecalicoccus pleomorphus]MBM6808439.1 class II D-tagatose-bisphosphate aldolase, non-catalytic subunit [Faecalicoccus pleomorphus]MDB7987142.1 class II D-tagatose-bisphosphate aldolase, non-catalytic subunit [Faecalicoccus pleomorphus]MDB7990998.1 class II D-tagatose-bisphosphate aldolase, non-catalytic subunit [Faecalicoc
MPKQNPLLNIIKRQKQGEAVGIYSCCSSNSFVIEAAIETAKKQNSCVLIESTANQVDQNGGYSGMTPKDFYKYCLDVAGKVGLDKDRIFLGGDHLGPLTVSNKPEAEAMDYAKTLVHDYVRAGFTKIHIDTSMKVADDDPNTRLSDETIARRGATLAKVCEEAYQELLQENPDAIHPVYIVGSEVPIPGGAVEEDAGMQVTKPEDFKSTVQTFEKAFEDMGIQDAWQYVMAAVVQPGVEEKDAGCEEYDRERAKDLMASIKEFDNLVFEGHSTDYQTKYKLKELIEDGVGILKVGPGLTYAAREGIFSLCCIEEELAQVYDFETSHFKEVLDEVMLENPGKWAPYYHGTEKEIAFKRKYSFSDRSRYYMPNPKVQDALNKLLNNLKEHPVSLPLLSQYMPIQYTLVREGKLENTPEALIKARVAYTIEEYTFATKQEQLVNE